MKKNKKGIYLASFTANHPQHNIIYQDINDKRDIGGDMMDIINSKMLDEYDYIIATPPCNWWSRANYRRNESEYALKTKHLLIDTLRSLCCCGIPFIVENVRNDKLFKQYGLFDYEWLYIYKIGRHTYWTNVEVEELNNIIQKPIVEIVNGKRKWLSSQNLSRKHRQGGEEVHEVIEKWLEVVEEL